MFPWQVFGLYRFVPTHPDFPVAYASSVAVFRNIGLSYLHTAAGQFRTLTGFPFHTPAKE